MMSRTVSSAQRRLRDDQLSSAVGHVSHAPCVVLLFELLINEKSKNRNVVFLYVTMHAKM